MTASTGVFVPEVVALLAQEAVARVAALLGRALSAVAADVAWCCGGSHCSERVRAEGRSVCGWRHGTLEPVDDVTDSSRASHVGNPKNTLSLQIMTPTYVSHKSNLLTSPPEKQQRRCCLRTGELR